MSLLAKQIAIELGITEKQVASAVKLFDEGNTIPFIARYRKEATGELDENVLRSIQERLNYLRSLEERKEEVIRLIAEQEKLTPELEAKIRASTKLVDVEDLYRPYKQKRRTRAIIAREKGLGPLADFIMAQNPSELTVEEAAADYINPEQDIHTIEDAIKGALDIIAENISDEAAIRQTIRDLARKHGEMAVKQAGDATDETYRMYFDYSEPVSKMPPHRVLAINRGENEKALTVKIKVDEGLAIQSIYQRVITGENQYTPYLQSAAEDAYKRLIAPSIEREIRNELTSASEEQAISVFSKNLKNLLLQPPVKGLTVMGIDPSYRTGCKIAVVDETGKVLDVGVVYPHAPQNKWQEAKKTIKERRYKTGRPD